MQAMGTWEETLIILTSDHFWWHPIVTRDLTGLEQRLALPHQIPFMVKLPYQKVSYAYQKPFNTIHTKEMIHQFGLGHIQSASDLAQVLNALREKEPNPIWETVVANTL